MRIFLYGVIATALVAGACNRDNSTAANAATPPANLTTSGDPALPVATAGSDATIPAAAVSNAADSRVDWREITIPSGTRLPVTLETAIGSDTSRLEESVKARVSRAILINGESVVPAGSEVTGVVTDATQSGKVKGRAHVAVRFDTLIPSGPDVANERYKIETSPVGRTAPATKKNDALKIGAPAAGGAVIGALLGGKKGAAIGTAVGGGAGTAVVLDTRGKEVHLGPGAALTLQLSQPVTIRVRARS